MKRLLATTALATLLAAGTAFAAEKMERGGAQAPAQTEQQKPDQMQEKSGMQEKSDQDAAKPAKQAETPGDLNFVKAQESNDWLASALIGRPVQGSQGDTLGDINDVIVGEAGETKAVLIGVGGFLGIGEKEVAVDFSALEFKERPMKQPVSNLRPGQLPRPATGQGQGSPLAGGRTQDAARPPASSPAQTAERKDDRHSNMIIVLNATKEQLESAPAFVRLGKTPKEESGAGQDVNRESKSDQPSNR